MASSEEKDGQEEGDDKKNEDSEAVLDLSGRRLKRLEKAPNNLTFATALVLDNNNLQNLSNLDSYGELERLSIANNQVIRMYWFARMYSLRILNLPNNNIVQIEGLRELHHLIHVNLSGNNIKTLDGVSHSHKLEHLNLSKNFITLITDLSMLKNLKELFLHRNHISTLHRCNKYLPSSLFILTLSDNGITDLNDLSYISHLANLEQFTILNNPALEPLHQIDENGDIIGPPLDFDNRPYVINWCLNLKVLDGYKVTPKESLKAEWLYSQGKGRGFQVGEHAQLVHYLSGICLAGGGWGGADLPDDDDKLGKILQLAKQHQQELRHSTVNGHDNRLLLNLQRAPGTVTEAAMTIYSSFHDSSSGRGSRGSNPHDSPASLRRTVSRTSSLRRNTSVPRPAKVNNSVGHKGCHPHSVGSDAVGSSTLKTQENATSHSYHVELSSTLYGGDLRTPDTPGLMTQSMDPSLLAQLSAAEYPPTRPLQPDYKMSQSLGPEHMAHSLQTDQMLSYSVGGLNETNNATHIDVMSQSFCPYQLNMSLSSTSQPNSAETWGIINKSLDNSTKAMRLYFEDQHSAQEQRAGSELYSGNMRDSLTSSTFLPASAIKTSYTTQTLKSSSTKSYSSHPIMSRSISRSSSAQRPKCTVKSPAMETSRLAPRSKPRSQSVDPPPCSIGNMSPRLRPSPKPAPRSSRTSLVSGSSLSSSGCNKISKSPTTPNKISEGESDNTDSEMSASKLHSLKLLATERKGRERRCIASSKNNIRSIDDGFYSHGTSSHSPIYNPEKYRSTQQSRGQRNGNASSNSSGCSLEGRSSSKSISKLRGECSMTEIHAAVTLQRYWRGYCTRFKNPHVAELREEIRQSRAENHIRHLTEKLKNAEAALESERKLRHLQLDAIRTLWSEIKKLHVGRTKDNTPSTPMTPLTPLTPLESAKKVGTTNKNKVYSEENVKELTGFCSSLQTQVSELQQSLSMVTQVMSAFCQLPGSQSLLTMSQSSGSGIERSAEDEEVTTSSLSHIAGTSISLSQSVTAFTNSILALTSNIVKTEEPQCVGDSSIKVYQQNGSKVKVWSTSKLAYNSQSLNGPPELAASITSLASNEMNSTGQDVSTLSNDSNEGEIEAQLQEAELSDSSQSSLSASFSGGQQNNGVQRLVTAPLRPSSLPVARPHTPRANS